jgi:type I restriction enzyme, S subunit
MRAASTIENERLARTRDELLPLLMSGKLGVKDAETVASEVLWPNSANKWRAG